MSDLQILTGMSILIAGFIQLDCGISAFHWQVLVYLAWFSSVTHLSCLTILRTFLYNHPSQRLWRLIGMLVVVVMLIVALLPTGQWMWQEQRMLGQNPFPPGGAYAICFYEKLDIESYTSHITVFPKYLNIMIMVLSVLLLAIGFLIRVVKLYKSVSVGFFKPVRSWLSKIALRWLRKLSKWYNTKHWFLRLARITVYRLLLIMFLLMRLILDVWTSTFLEVCISHGSDLYYLTATDLVASYCTELGSYSLDLDIKDG